jgi:hypothetical protein
VQTIHASTLKARWLVCSHIRVDSAVLLDGCRIEYAEFRDDLVLDRSSSVSMLSDRSQRVPGAAAERKQA